MAYWLYILCVTERQTFATLSFLRGVCVCVTLTLISGSSFHRFYFLPTKGGREGGENLVYFQTFHWNQTNQLVWGREWAVKVKPWLNCRVQGIFWPTIGKFCYTCNFCVELMYPSVHSTNISNCMLLGPDQDMGKSCN